MGTARGAQVAPPETKQIKSIPNQLSNRIPALKFRCPAEFPLHMNCQSHFRSTEHDCVTQH